MDWNACLTEALDNLHINDLSELIYMHGGEQELNRRLWKELDKLISKQPNPRRYYPILEKSIGRRRADIAVIDTQSPDGDIVCVLEAKAQVYLERKQYRQLEKDIAVRLDLDTDDVSQDCRFYCIMWTKSAGNNIRTDYEDSIRPKYLNGYVKGIDRHKVFSNDVYKDIHHTIGFPNERATIKPLTSKDIPVSGEPYNGFDVALHGAIYTVTETTADKLVD